MLWNAIREKNNRSFVSPSKYRLAFASELQVDERMVGCIGASSVRQGTRKWKPQGTYVHYLYTCSEVTLKSINQVEHMRTYLSFALFIGRSVLEHGAPLLAPSCGPLTIHFSDCRLSAMSPVNPGRHSGSLIRRIIPHQDLVIFF